MPGLGLQGRKEGAESPLGNGKRDLDSVQAAERRHADPVGTTEKRDGEIVQAVERMEHHPIRQGDRR